MRALLAGALVSLITIGCLRDRAAEVMRHARATDPPYRPVIGAIRWDAWIGDVAGYDVGREVERSLAPLRWRYRLPFYAQEISPTEVRVRASTQTVMDAEIEYARAAGLDYWAFVMYPPDNPQTRGGLDLYLRSARRRDVRFAMIVQSYTFGDGDIARLVECFKSDSYQTVAGGRPLIFMLGPQKVADPAWPNVKARVDRLRAAALHARITTPYIVHLWGWDRARAVVDWLGLDAISAYSLNFDDRGAPYASLARKIESKWDDWRASGAKVVPLVTTGWDRRPRVEHPVSWEPPGRPDAIDFYYEAPTPVELAAHLQNAIDWCRRYPSAADASAVLIYAWNENDEGGWLVPSLSPAYGNARLQAVGRVLTRPRTE
jgi:hypothetical protein